MTFNSTILKSAFSMLFVFLMVQAGEVTAAPRAEVVLDCQVSFGDFQEIRVVKMVGESYALRTLDNSGSQHEYAMEPGAWPSKTLNVPCPREAVKSCGTVYVESSSGEWMYDLGQNGYQNIGYCR